MITNRLMQADSSIILNRIKALKTRSSYHNKISLSNSFLNFIVYLDYDIYVGDFENKNQ